MAATIAEFVMCLKALPTRGMDGSVESLSMAFFSPHCLGLKGHRESTQTRLYLFPTPQMAYVSYMSKPKQRVGECHCWCPTPRLFLLSLWYTLRLISLLIQPEDISLMGFTLHVKENVNLSVRCEILIPLHFQRIENQNHF
jgi:hypothetical protein